MNASTPNIKLSYLYRDAGNYKQFGFEVFSNPGQKSLPDIEKAIQARLTDGTYFEARKWNLKSLHKHAYDPDFDHNWHEFEKIEPTHAVPTSDIDLTQFLQLIDPDG
jgi:hypothetical protein